MNYFVNENIFTLNSGTEFSAVQRLKMFHDHQVEAKILTRNYNPQLAGDLARVELTHEDVINMYDYFQEITNLPEKDVNVRYTEAIDKREYHIEGVDANESLIKHAGRTIGKVSIAPATVGLVGSMEYYDDMNHTVARDIWDRRGFKSSTQLFHPDGSLGPQIFFNFEGKPKLEITRMNIQGSLNPTMYKLLDYKGKNYRFNTEQDLFIFFMNELAAMEPSVFINDRPSLIPAVAAIKGAIGKWQFLHNVHSQNNRQAGASRQVVSYLQEFFTHYREAFDGVITATEEQKDEIAKYYQFKHILALPDTFATDFEQVPAEARDIHRVIYLSRISQEKKPIDVIEIFAKARQQLPDLKLDFYGYSSSEDLKKSLDQLVETNHLKEVISFKGYQIGQALEEALDKAGLLLNTSEGEAFGINVLEGLSHGLPVVAYKVKYGLSEQIEDGENGYFVPYGAVDAAANHLVKALSSKEDWQRLSKAAYAKAQEFSESAAWQRWLNHKVIADNLFLVSAK